MASNILARALLTDEEKEELGQKRRQAGASEDMLNRKANAYVRNNMILCNINGVFGYLPLKAGKPSSRNVEESERRAALRSEYADFPVIRMIINISSTPPHASQCVLDSEGPILAIQTDGTDMPFLKAEEQTFFRIALSSAERCSEGKLERLEAHLHEPPITRTFMSPYNPTFAGYLHDNDGDIFGGAYSHIVSGDDAKQKEERISSKVPSDRPQFYYPSLGSKTHKNQNVPPGRV